MPIRRIIRYPDPRLALAAQPVTVFDGALRDLTLDLLDTMHAAPGIGITAPHIGISLRVVVLDLDPVEGARTYVNPQIILGLTRDDHASGRQRLDARCQR
jgi:peptide deformylase